MAHTSGIHVVHVRYGGATQNTSEKEVVDAYAASGSYDLMGGASAIQEPVFPEDRRVEDVDINLGLIGGEIAIAVAEGRRAGQPVLVVGGNCCITPSVIGGLQQAHGADARIGLIWFDAHGDFNTPGTTYSGMMGGMPVAVSAGLCWPRWREHSGLLAPLPTDRIVMVDVRNLDDREETLVKSTDVVVAATAEGFPGVDLTTAVNDLAAQCDILYLHIDSDILDESYVPNHGTKEPNGPNMQQTLDAVETVMATGKVAAYAIVSVWKDGEGGDITLASGQELLRGGLERWAQHGMPEVPLA